MGKKLCRYVLGMHRSSDIEGVFVLTDEELEIIKELDGYEVYYGEIAGKHSEVTCELYIKDVEILADKEEEVAFFERILPHGAGFSFKGYWFDTDRAGEHGWDAGRHEGYETAEEALKDYKKYDNSVMREHFVDGFNQGLEDRKNG
jgi:hypothetical protein